MKEFLLRRDYITFLLLSIPCALWVGNRGNTNDTQIYFNIFKNINELNLSDPKLFYYETGVEIGYGWYSYIINQFTESPVYLFSIFSLLSFFFVFKVTQKIKLPYIPVFFLYISSSYFLMQHFMQMRQGLSIPLALFALCCLFYSNKKISLEFLIFSILAFSLHQTSIVLISFGYVFYLITLKMKFSLNKYRLFLFFILISFLFLSKFLLVGILISVSGRLTSYLNTSYGQELEIFRLPNIRAILIFLLVILFLTREMLDNVIVRVFLCLLSISVAFRIGLSDVAILSGRFSTVFSHVEIFLLPFIFYRLGGIKGKVLLFCYIVVQAIIVYVFQAPYILEAYYFPLY